MGGRGASGGARTGGGSGGASGSKSSTRKGGGGGSGLYDIPKFTSASLDKMSRSQIEKLYNKVAVNQQIKQSSQWSKVTISRSEAQHRVNSLLGASSTSAMKRYIKKYGKK